MHHKNVKDSETGGQVKQLPRRAANLIYGVNDSVPAVSLIPLVTQQVIMLSVDLIFPCVDCGGRGRDSGNGADRG